MESDSFAPGNRVSAGPARLTSAWADRLTWAIVAGIAASYFLGLTPAQDDFAAYIMHAANLVEHRPYTAIHYAPRGAVGKPRQWLSTCLPFASGSGVLAVGTGFAGHEGHDGFHIRHLPGDIREMGAAAGFSETACDRRDPGRVESGFLELPRPDRIRISVPDDLFSDTGCDSPRVR